MMILRMSSPCFLLVSILALLSVCAGARDRTRGATRAPRNANGANRKGRFNLNSGMQCTWSTGDVEEEEVRMTIKCENPRARLDGGETDLQCEYRARPQTCPGYKSDPRGYYKQVARALKKLQGRLCRDERALVKAGMCKRAPRDAHFKVDIATSVASAQSGGDTLPKEMNTSTTTRSTTRTTTTTPAPSVNPTDCKRRADHSQVAQEYCSSSWASVCSFFLSMLQSDDC